MGYNESCLYQNCTYQCCNINGDCPEWYSNGNTNYTECYYYYGIDPTLIIWTSVATAVAALVIIIVACFCYREYQKKRDSLMKMNSQFEISNQTLETKPDVMVLGNKEVSSDQNEKMQRTTMIPYGQALTMSQMSRTGAIQGIGNSYDKQI